MFFKLIRSIFRSYENFGKKWEREYVSFVFQSIKEMVDKNSNFNKFDHFEDHKFCFSIFDNV